MAVTLSAHLSLERVLAMTVISTSVADSRTEATGLPWQAATGMESVVPSALTRTDGKITSPDPPEPRIDTAWRPLLGPQATSTSATTDEARTPRMSDLTMPERPWFRVPFIAPMTRSKMPATEAAFEPVKPLIIAGTESLQGAGRADQLAARATATIGDAGGSEPNEPWNETSPKLKMPPSSATMR